jgi:hypothetical protein
MRALLLVLLFVACGCPQKPDPTPGGGPTTMPTPAQPPVQQPPAQQPPAQQPPVQQPPVQQPPAQPPVQAAAGIGETCGAGDACAQGLTCVKYFGIAGPRGGEFKSCEIQCKGGTGCPAGHNCVTIADGPGQVCRK